MAVHILRFKINGGPDITSHGSIEKLADVPRFLKNAERSVRDALRTIPALKEHKVLSVTIRPE